MLRVRKTSVNHCLSLLFLVVGDHLQCVEDFVVSGGYGNQDNDVCNKLDWFYETKKQSSKATAT